MEGKNALVTAQTTDGRKSFTVTRSVFDRKENPNGAWRTETIEHVRNIPCKECRQYMAFIEW